MPQKDHKKNRSARECLQLSAMADITAIEAQRNKYNDQLAKFKKYAQDNNLSGVFKGKLDALDAEEKAATQKANAAIDAAKALMILSGSAESG